MDVGFWHQLDNGRIQCDLCPRFCQLTEGQRGLCFVRARSGDKMVLTTYGRSSGFCIDPIEKKPLNHFYPGTPVLSFGTAGCNLTCKFCQNWDISKSRQMDTVANRAEPELIAMAAKQTSSHSVAYTYNDPVIFLEYAIDTALACREQGIKSVAVTAGYITEKGAEKFFPVMDAANVDLKAFSEAFYSKLAGGHLQPVLEILEYIKKETSVWLELSTLLIPGQNDSEPELRDMTQWVVDRLGPDVPMHFSAFHPAWKMGQTPPTSQKTLAKARQIALESGVRYAYTGNIADSVCESSYCHSCGELLIERVRYQLGRWHLDEDGCCKRCSTPCAGVFAEKPGDWGAKRVQVNMSSG
ncbi:MAG: AmmeMemoRadiSam system radical SAM enzyme [Magnetococcales bacterium]|nr:AmmeMemoRadiSam system radical SAM enzyme [Magnetococcales bacterium]